GGRLQIFGSQSHLWLINDLVLHEWVAVVWIGRGNRAEEKREWSVHDLEGERM
ncbi:hypothetical protein L195_g016443, partial [Trifolium pratense]